MIILDTHVWWWAISEPERLSSKASELIRDTEERCVASISLWEFAMMATRGRIDLVISPYEWLRHSMEESDIVRLFYFEFNQKTYVITSGYVKKQQKLNKQEIKRAYRLMLQYIEEHSDDQT
ncbi:MAG: PIN domain-containing protein [Gammaproteobacteria bacterium]|nr:PIN domain-containing protein [Gammaproteobacteria bacterium]